MTDRVYTAPAEPNRVYLQFIEQIQTVIPFDSCIIYLARPEQASLSPIMATGILHTLPVLPYEAGDTVDTFMPYFTRIDPDAQAQLVIPAQDGDHLFGIVSVTCHRPQAYTPQHEHILQAMTSQLAMLVKTMHHNRTLLGAHNQLVAHVEEHRRQLGALQRLAAITSATANLDVMLTNALRETAEILHCEGAQILLPDDEMHYELVLHEPSLYGVTQAWPRRTWPLDGPGKVIDAYHTGESLYENDLLPPDTGVACRNALYSPLNTRRRTLGVLNLVNRTTGDFTTEHLELAETIARQIAVSISSAQKFAAERERADMLNLINHISQELYAILNQQALLDRACALIRKALHPHAVYVMQLDETRTRLNPEASAFTDPSFDKPANQAIAVLADSVIRDVIQSGQVQNIPDLRIGTEYVPLDESRRLQSCLIVPLRRSEENVGETVIGAVVLLSRRINAFSETDQDVLETLATQLSIALENARLYQQMQRRLLEQNIVYQIGQDLTAILNLPDLCNAVVRHMNRALSVSACMVELYEEKHRAIRVEADYRANHHRKPDGPLLTGAYLALDEHCAIAKAIHTRQPVTFYVDDPGIPACARGLLNDLGDHSQLIVPMVTGDNVIGVVEWLDQEPGRRFSADDIQLARTLVAQATIAIQNALLFTELEARARQLAEANTLRSQFLAMISHELRTPMNSIIGFSETIMEGLYGALNERQASRMDRIRENGYTLLALIDDLLDLSKIDAGRMILHTERIGLEGTIRATVQTLEAQLQAKGLAVVYDLNGDLPRVQADPQRLAQVITNLLSNAIKFTHAGSITITCRDVMRKNRRFVQTGVTDTGIGISKADQDYIFDEFRQVDSSSTRQYGGTGMGLAITKRLVEMMEGSIWVESELGQGSTFYFTLPVAI
ncbi:MAG: GAF domain-containing protein [Anaerolineae bacterium]|nr:GAF domain-containing protein [Anaerolineae bacterium]